MTLATFEARHSDTTVHGIVGRSRAIVEVVRQIRFVAAVRSTVLITGETGTGKELVARAIHQSSAQRHMPFVRVNCAAVPETLLESELFGHVRGAFTDATHTRRGKFALAHGGSIFLDEVAAMNPALQPRLLRVLQEREIEPLGAERTETVDVRVVAATNRNLRELVQRGAFQEDLFYRLHVVPIVVPPLRERLEDVPVLVEHFLGKHAARAGRRVDRIDPGVVAALQDYGWPGNVRELENTIERAVVFTTGTSLTRDSVVIGMSRETPERPLPSLTLEENVRWAEYETLRRALDMAPLRRDAARLLGISPRALSYYLGKYPSLDARA